jgi:competence protein ComEC
MAFRQDKRKPVLIILGVLVGLNVLAWLAVWDLSHNFLEVIFFDVGQGDSIFIEIPHHGLGGGQILIDGGPSSVILEKLGTEMPFWDRTLDLVILTHPEHDHMAGLLEVLKRYEVKNILWTGILRPTAEFQEWQKLIAQEGAEIHIARSTTCALSESAYLEILYPFESMEGKEIANTNNTSIVARLVFGANSFLFTGDASQAVEKKLLQKDIDSDVLKVGHHGSKTSSAEEFIRAVSPKIAVISVGKDNSYGQPHSETLAVLEKYGITVLRTDISGDIKIISNGHDFSTF